MSKRVITVPVELEDFTADGGIDARRLGWKAFLALARDGIRLTHEEIESFDFTTGTSPEGDEVLLAVMTFRPQRRTRRLGRILGRWS